MCSSFSKGSSCFVSLIAWLIVVPVKATHTAEGVRMDGKCSPVLYKVCLFCEYDQVDTGCKCISIQTGNKLC